MGLEPVETDLCLSASCVLSQLSTDHTTKAKAGDRKALPTLHAQTITPGAHPCTSAVSYNTSPHGPALSPRAPAPPVL